MFKSNLWTHISRTCINKLSFGRFSLTWVVISWFYVFLKNVNKWQCSCFLYWILIPFIVQISRKGFFLNLSHGCINKTYVRAFSTWTTAIQIFRGGGFCPSINNCVYSALFSSICRCTFSSRVFSLIFGNINNKYN